MPETFGACVNSPTEMKLTLHDKNLKDPDKWHIKWYQVKEGRWTKRFRKLISQDTTTLRVENPTLQMSGDMFEVDVSNKFGFARGTSRIIVTEGISNKPLSLLEQPMTSLTECRKIVRMVNLEAFL